MLIPEEQQRDLDILKGKIANVKLKAFDYTRYCLGASFDPATSGHKTVEAAVVYGIKSALAEIKALEAEYVKNWPDTK